MQKVTYSYILKIYLYFLLNTRFKKRSRMNLDAINGICMIKTPCTLLSFDNIKLWISQKANSTSSGSFLTRSISSTMLNFCTVCKTFWSVNNHLLHLCHCTLASRQIPVRLWPWSKKWSPTIPETCTYLCHSYDSRSPHQTFLWILICQSTTLQNKVRPYP